MLSPKLQGGFVARRVRNGGDRLSAIRLNSSPVAARLPQTLWGAVAKVRPKPGLLVHSLAFLYSLAI